jgi:hypothetical protein
MKEKEENGKERMLTRGLSLFPDLQLYLHYSISYYITSVA